MIKIKTLPYELPFKHPFGISRNTKKVQPLVLVQLETEGYTGLGEAPANQYYGITVPRLQKDLKNVRSLLENTVFSTPEALWKKLKPVLKNNLFALCAIDLAAWDIY